LHPLPRSTYVLRM